MASGTVSVNPSGNVGGTCPNQATSQNVTIRNLTAPTISGSNPRFVACGNQQITISASSVTNANSYKWTLPAGIVPASGTTTTTTPSITVNLTENASGEIRVRAHDGSCSYDGPNSGALVITRKGATPLLTWTWTEKEICQSESKTITASNSAVPANYRYEWYTTNGLHLNGGLTSPTSTLITTTGSVSISFPAGVNAGGQAEIRVRSIPPAGQSCPPSDWRVRIIQVGPYSSDVFSINGPTQACPGQAVYFSMNPGYLEGILAYNWTYPPSPWDYMGGQGTGYLDLITPYGSFNSGVVTLKVSNRCGWTNSPATKHVYENYFCSGGYSLDLYPNPASDELTVSVTETGESGSTLSTASATGNTAGEFEIKLIDPFSRVRLKTTTTGGKVKLDVRKLPEGTYFLHATRGQMILRRQVLIKR